MFTVEFDWDEVAVTILDETGKQEDIGVYIYDDLVYIRQWVEEEQRHHVIQLTPAMFDEFKFSFDQTEGAYIVDRRQSGTDNKL